MIKYIFFVMLCFVMPCFVSAKPVAHPINHNINHNHSHFRNSNIRRFNYGYRYKGFRWNHWNRHVWSARYNTFIYYNPFTYGWYYWCQPDDCWYPVTYAPYGVYNWDNSPDLSGN